MFSENMLSLLKNVILSWQVIVVTIGLILYLNLVFYTASSYRRPRARKKFNLKKKKKTAPAPTPAATKETNSASNDELGLEES